MREAKLQQEAQTQPKLELPSVADIQCTQNAGHGVVIPSGGGIAARNELSRMKDQEGPGHEAVMQELSPEMSEKERMTSVFTAAPRTVLLSETTDRLKLEVPDAMSPAAQVVQRTVEMPQVQFINRVVRISVVQQRHVP